MCNAWPVAVVLIALTLFLRNLGFCSRQPSELKNIKEKQLPSQNSESVTRIQSYKIYSFY